MNIKAVRKKGQVTYKDDLSELNQISHLQLWYPEDS